MSRTPYFAIISAYLTWGLMPLYWVLLADVPSLYLLPYRAISSFALLALIVLVFYRKELLSIPKYGMRNISLYILAAVLVGINWTTFMYSAQLGRSVDTGMGYFLMPFVSFAFAFFILNEPFSRMMTIAVALAALATTFLIFSKNVNIWVPLVIALSFGPYGYIKKISKIPTMEGMIIETVTLAIVSFFAVLFMPKMVGDFADYDLTMQLLIFGTGASSLALLLTFAYAASRISLRAMAWMQYIAPSIQFLLGIFYFKNPLDIETAVAVVLIWIAISLVLWEQFHRARTISRSRIAPTG